VLESAKELLIRARHLGASRPDHYLIPALVIGTTESKCWATIPIRCCDPTKPTKGWRAAWRKLTAAAGLKGLRGHDLRHKWVTSHAEVGTPQSVLEAQAKTAPACTDTAVFPPAFPAGNNQTTMLVQ